MENVEVWSPPFGSLNEEEETKLKVRVSAGTSKSGVDDESGSGLEHVDASSASNEEDMDDKHLIQLTSTNYQRWKYEVQAILESKEVMDIVDGTVEKPTDPSMLKKWMKSDATARMVLSRSLDDEHHSFIRACKTSAEIWKTLVTIKERTTSSTNLIASQDFAAFRFDPGMTIGSLLAAFNAIVGKMESSGLTVDDATKIGKVLHCLPMEYDSFRQSWRLTKDDEATFTDLQSQLLATEADIKSRDALAASGGEAFVGKNVSGGEDRRPRSKAGNDPGERKVKDNRSKGVKCYYCHRKGHIKRDCQQREHDESTGTSEEEDSSDGSVVSDRAYVALTSDHWLVDSGASSHITSNRVHGHVHGWNPEVVADKGRSDSILSTKSVMDVNSDFEHCNMKRLWSSLESLNCVVHLDYSLERLLLKATFLKARMQVEKMLLFFGQDTNEVNGGLDVDGCSSDRLVTVVGGDSDTMMSNECASDNVVVNGDREATSESEIHCFTRLPQKMNSHRGNCGRLNKEPKTTAPQQLKSNLEHHKRSKKKPRTMSGGFCAAKPSTAEEVVSSSKELCGTMCKGMQSPEVSKSGTLTSTNGGVARRKRSKKRKRTVCGILSLGDAHQGQVF